MQQEAAFPPFSPKLLLSHMRGLRQRVFGTLPLLVALFVFSLVLIPRASQAGLYISVGIAPPALPVYDQPPIPGDGYLWTPGYWAWNADAEDYYWVPGAWVMPPEPSYLWTPGYWGYDDGAYVWNAGYWGPTVGFYGGVCYGFGYTGVGFSGGYWSGGSFFYNTAVTNISNTTVINNVYNRTVINNAVSNVSYNGGPRGVRAVPTPEQRLAANERHLPPTGLQLQHQQLAGQNRELFSKFNHGKPAIAAVSNAGHFAGPGVFAAKAAGNVRPGGFGNTTRPGGFANTGRPGGFGNAARGNRLLANNNRGPNLFFPNSSRGSQNYGRLPGRTVGNGFNGRTAGLNRNNSGFQNRGNPGFNRSLPRMSAFNPGAGRSFSPGFRGGQHFNAALGPRPMGGMGRPPMHFPQGRPSGGGMARRGPPQGNFRRH
jgi:hypothetical protein